MYGQVMREWAGKEITIEASEPMIAAAHCFLRKIVEILQLSKSGMIWGVLGQNTLVTQLENKIFLIDFSFVKKKIPTAGELSMLLLIIKMHKNLLLVQL